MRQNQELAKDTIHKRKENQEEAVQSPTTTTHQAYTATTASVTIHSTVTLIDMSISEGPHPKESDLLEDHLISQDQSQREEREETTTPLLREVISKTF